MITYSSRQEGFTLVEKKNMDDIEFAITIHDVERFLPSMNKIRVFFERDDILTDVMFYAYQQHEYKIIVRHDYYVDFVLYLFKYQFVDSIEWIA